jgi:hypothetical protein
MPSYNLPPTSIYTPLVTNYPPVSAPKPTAVSRPEPVVTQTVQAPVRNYQPVVEVPAPTPSQSSKPENSQKPIAKALEPSFVQANKRNGFYDNLQNTFISKRASANEIPTVNQARLIYRQQKQDYPTPGDIAETVNSNIQKDKAELRTAMLRQRHQVDQELGSQVQQHQTIEQFNKSMQKELHKASTGFEFEWYSRHPKMQEFGKETRQFQKQQTSEEAKRKLAEQAEYRKAPSSILKPEEYQELANAGKQELFQAKKSIQDELKNNYDQTKRSHQKLANNEHSQKLQDERASIEATKKYIEEQNRNAAEVKQQRNLEMNSTLGSIEKRKHKEWSQKLNATSNQQLSKVLDSEKQRLKADFANERSKQSQEYAQDLSKHSHYNKERRTREERERIAQHKGLDFE